MSKFTKVYRKWHAKNNGKYDSAREYHKALMCKFGDWQPPKKLVVVPQFVADFIENKKGDLKLYGAFHEIYKNMHGTDLHLWVSEKNDRQESFAKAWIDGYTVEKEQLYYLCEKNTGYYLNKKGDSLKLVVNPYFDENNEFTQSEIDELNIGSYEQIEV